MSTPPAITRSAAFGAILLGLCITSCAFPRDTNALPSWNDGPAREAILDFVARVSEPGSAEFVPKAERVAVFDNDGCLWSEQPMYFQLAFALDRITEMAPEHPEWNDEEPFHSVLAGDLGAVMAGGEEAILELVLATHAGMSTDEFRLVVRGWLDSARHPSSDRPFDEMVFQPMLELLAHLRANGFKTFIVSGGGVEFMRVFSEEVYGIPPEQVIGSSIKTRFEMRGDQPVIVRDAEIEFIDDKAGKPIGISRFIGRRPIFVAGNSDGDLQMLQYVTLNNPRPSFGMIVHHTDGEREVAYDRESSVGHLDKALDAAPSRGWTVVSMKDDWKQVFPAP